MESLVDRIRLQARATPKERVFPPVRYSLVRAAQAVLGFSFPPLLSECLTTIGNGGFGPGYGIIGLQGGNDSDFGSLIETYEQLSTDFESDGRRWPLSMLPFCSWGCNIFSCVECDGVNDVYTFDEGELEHAGYDVEEFFNMWLSGQAILE